jgi:Big-like domain-containing protein
MIRFTACTILCLALLCNGMACTPQPVAPPTLSEHGYTVSLYVSEPLIWLGLPGPGFPQETVLTVRVRDAQGQPVDGIPVMFQVEPSWTHDISLTSEQERSRNGEARTVLGPRTTGVVRVEARVDNAVLHTAITISRRSIPDTSS